VARVGLQALAFAGGLTPDGFVAGPVLRMYRYRIPRDRAGIVVTTMRQSGQSLSDDQETMIECDACEDAEFNDYRIGGEFIVTPNNSQVTSSVLRLSGLFLCVDQVQIELAGPARDIITKPIAGRAPDGEIIALGGCLVSRDRPLPSGLHHVHLVVTVAVTGETRCAFPSADQAGAQIGRNRDR